MSTFKKLILLTISALSINTIARCISQTLDFSLHNAISLITISICLFYWILSVDIRISSKHLRFYLMAIGYLLFAYILIQRIKYDISYSVLMDEYIWYAYYIPMIFVPFFGVVMARHLGTHNHKYLYGIDYLLLFVSTILTIGILTNHFHHFAFQFENPNGKYTYGFLYYITYRNIETHMVYS